MNTYAVMSRHATHQVIVVEHSIKDISDAFEQARQTVHSQNDGRAMSVSSNNYDWSHCLFDLFLNGKRISNVFYAGTNISGEHMVMSYENGSVIQVPLKEIEEIEVRVFIKFDGHKNPVYAETSGLNEKGDFETLLITDPDHLDLNLKEVVYIQKETL